jgi:translocation and assembly module TamB
MTKRSRLLPVIFSSVAALILIIIVTALIVVQTAWFQNFVREKIITATEDATGGAVEIGSFSFDWTRMRVAIRNFVIHGTEPSSAEPLLRIEAIDLQFSLLSGYKHLVDLRYLGITRPSANIIVFPDGNTNLPQPKVVKKSSGTSGLQTVVDLQVKRFLLSNGRVQFAKQSIPLNARGQNLRVALIYDRARPAYDGKLTLDPIYAQASQGSAVTAHLELPVRIEGDAVSLSGARLFTDKSNIALSGKLEHLASPIINAKANAHVNIAEIQAAMGLPSTSNVKGAPSNADADVAIRMDDQRINVETARFTVGESNFEASGILKDLSRQSSLQFKGQLILNQLSKLAKLSIQPSGTITLSGNASMPGNSSYLVTGSIQGRDIRAKEGANQYGPLALSTQFSADPHLVRVDRLRVAAFDGELTGRAELRELRQLTFDGRLSGFELQHVARDLGSQPVGYSGTISGSLHAEGDLKTKGTRGYSARALVDITPGHQGTPVSGRISAQYSGAAETVALGNSYIALPHSRLDLIGILGSRLDLKLSSRNLNDFLPAMRLASRKSTAALPVQLQSGSANLNAAVAGPLRSPHISGNILVTNFTVEQRNFDRLSANLDASASGARIGNGLLQRDTLRAHFDGGIGLQQWSTSPHSPLAVNASIQNAQLSDLMALSGKPPQQLTGLLNASANISGTLGNPSGGADLRIQNGTAYGEAFDRANAHVGFADQLVKLQPVEIVAGEAHLSSSGTYVHPRESLATGHVQFTVSTNDVALAQFKTLQARHPGLDGLINLNANLTADVVKTAASSTVALRTVNANLAARNLSDKSGSFGDLTASARTTANIVTYVLDSNLASSSTTVRGSTTLTPDYPTTLDAKVASLNLRKVLSLAGRSDLPVDGVLTAQARINGPIRNPAGNLSIDLTKASVYGEPVDDLNGQVIYAADNVSIPSLQVTTPAGSIRLNGNLKHAPGDFDQGQIALHIDSSQILLARIPTLQKSKAGLAGSIRIETDLDAGLNLTNKQMPLQVAKLDANVNAESIEFNGQDFGSLSLKAQTKGKQVAVNLDSNLAKSTVHGAGSVQLAAGYPVDAKLTFTNVKYSNLQPLLTSGSSAGTRSDFDASLNGLVTLQGPVTQVQQVRGLLTLNQLAITGISLRGSQGPAELTLLQNQAPIVVVLDHSRVDIRSLHLVGRNTDISASGSIDFSEKAPLNLKVNAATDLALLQDFSRDIYSGGSITARTDIGGTFAQPAANGQIELKNASVNVAESPNGISNANGVILLNGTSAVIRNLTAESGGGKIVVNGFAALAGKALRYGLRANATKVRTRLSGASITSSANLTLNGTTEHSLVNGTVTIDRIALAASADTGSFLSSTASPPETPGAPSGVLAGMRLDIHVVTSPALSVQTSVTQNFSANADLTVRGTVTNPGVLGQVVVTQGNLVFFGNRYTVNRAVVNFYNPVKIEPILDVELQTTVKGVNVNLGVTGPVDNMKLNYRSDPPLRFDEIVSLLATGKTPTSDPTIAAHEPTPPDQSLTQRGESAIVSQAVAAPIASRIQRVFGVNQLKIDPTFASGSSIPQARVSLQQEITPTILFTYTTDLSQTTAQIVRVEWAFTPRFSAVATRDENGIVSLDFFIKRHFR